VQMTRGVKKENLPSKVCVTCERPFTWRKKWERCWDEVTTCSNSCNSTRKNNAQQARRAQGSEQPLDEAAPQEVSSSTQDGIVSKKDRKRATKAAQKAKREGGRDGKDCNVCCTEAAVLIRCRIDASMDWKMVCKQCWGSVSGGVPDGDSQHPHYQYGGLWKQ